MGPAGWRFMRLMSVAVLSLSGYVPMMTLLMTIVVVRVLGRVRGTIKPKAVPNESIKY
jgi:hypothetical protein